ncbi:MAG: trimethylamine methyltransferase family protein [Chloroflexota bacterium]|nr:trimethylamine methyltransferase family protein [Chloroflexota bacterium]
MFESSIHVLSQANMDLIHGSAIEILRDVGVRVDHPRMRDLLSDFGCLVEGTVVKFPEAVTEDVVRSMRDPGNLVDGYVGTLPLDRNRIPDDARIVPVATAQATIAHDLETDELRPATQQDLVDACRVVNSLPGAVTAHPVFLPQDAPEMVQDLYALRVTAQHYPYSDFVEIYSPEVVPYFLEMGRVICDSDETLKESPPFCSWAFATPPLQFGRHGFDIVFELKDFGLKKGYGVGGVMPILGASTPLTLSGYLVMQSAEVLACNIMNWVLLGRIVGYSGGPAIMDMRRGAASQSAAEANLLFLACMDLQRYYGDPDPIYPYALSADAKFPDVQAGIDKTFSATVAVLAGSRILSAGLGILGLSGVASLAQLVIDYELCQSLEHFVRGFEVDEAHIGLENIKKIGIGGSFLAEDHTLEYMRETLFFPELFDRRMLGSFQQDRKGMLDHAKDKVRGILKNGEHREYLDREQVRELDRIAQRAKEEIQG